VAADHFTYLMAPTVTKLSAKGGAAAGGSTVTITGTGFGGATSVSFGANDAAHFTVNSTISITATSPAGSGLVDVKVTTAGGTSAASKHDEWGYAPAVEAVAPANGPVTGGTRVTITGVGFVPGAGDDAEGQSGRGRRECDGGQAEELGQSAGRSLHLRAGRRRHIAAMRSNSSRAMPSPSIAQAPVVSTTRKRASPLIIRS
jgi:hypothetical protein